MRKYSNKSLKTVSKALLITLLSIVTVLNCFGCGNSNGGKGNKVGTLRIFTYTGHNYEGIEMDSVFKKIEEKVGVELMFEGVSTADYYTKLAPMMNTGDFPDMIWSSPKNAEGNFESWADPDGNDLLWNIDELLVGNEDRYPYITKIFNSPTFKNLKYFDGHYLVPNVSSLGWTIYYRADWLKAIGFVDDQGNAKAPVTLDEFEYVMQKFTGTDLFTDGNGTKSGKTWGISPNAEVFYINPLYHAFGITCDWDFDKSGNIDYMYTTESIKPYLEWMNAMYNKGYIDPQFNTNTGSKDRDKWYAGQVGCIMTNGGEHMTWVVGSFEQQRGENKVIVGPAPVGTGNVSTITGKVLGVEGESGISNWGNFYGGYSITKACKEPEKALDLLEYMVSPEGSNLRTYGIEGVHYTMSGGNVSPILDKREIEGSTYWQVTAGVDGSQILSGGHKIGALFGHVIDWDHFDQTGEILADIDYGCLYPKYADLLRESSRLRVVKSGKMVNFTNFPTSISVKMKTIQDRSATYVLNAIMGNKNLTSDWDTMIADCNRDSLQNIKSIIKSEAIRLGVV